MGVGGERKRSSQIPEGEGEGGRPVPLKEFSFKGSSLFYHFSDLYANMLMHAN